MALINSRQIEYPLTGSFIDDGSGKTSISASSIVGLELFKIVTGSVTASVNIGPDIFLIKSGSNVFFNIENNSNTTINSNLFIIKNFTTQQPIFTVSESIVQIATHSFEPSESIDYSGGLLFTSSSFYVSLG